MATRSALGDFLRARRELVQPADVGLPGGGLRRTPGLRREEVAMLAGISAEYYLRLEQGRDRTPSPQVVEALARVLQLDAAGTEHLTGLARPKTRRRPAASADRVPAGLEMLVGTLNVPAFVVNRYRDVLAANRLAVSLSPLMRPGTNRLLTLFTDPQAREYHPDLDENAASVVAQLRAEVGADTEDPRLQSLIGELSLKSQQFRRLWARHDIRRGGSEVSLIRHPQVGELRLRREKLAVVGAEGMQLVLYHAEPGSPAADALTLLATLEAADPAQVLRPRGAEAG
ncbi:transcriptional regulator [Kineosporia sp. NBRC 101677]|uniref:helix-turn-helix transcriptional regulator n=1 Tax=Kineosporia sp. NBRC 101677 TaxID=3032197 RepID=UPI0024A18871|nr:helix-turn-helix transcriptional regulator [Kineosporia sp. NBRC 101677]GLY16762.1 transcriptional regulator [Kineosporia sp. NBRC 101677]